FQVIIYFTIKSYHPTAARIRHWLAARKPCIDNREAAVSQNNALVFGTPEPLPVGSTVALKIVEARNNCFIEGLRADTKTETTGYSTHLANPLNQEPDESIYAASKNPK